MEHSFAFYNTHTHVSLFPPPFPSPFSLPLLPPPFPSPFSLPFSLPLLPPFSLPLLRPFSLPLLPPSPPLSLPFLPPFSLPPPHCPSPFSLPSPSLFTLPFLSLFSLPSPSLLPPLSLPFPSPDLSSVWVSSVKKKLVLSIMTTWCCAWGLNINCPLISARSQCLDRPISSPSMMLMRRIISYAGWRTSTSPNLWVSRRRG